MISGSGDPITYNCDGITTEFPITADLGLSDDTAVQVFHTDSAGVETKWSKGTEYSVVAGNVVTAAIYPATDKITIAPELNDQQLLDLIDGDPLDPDNLEGSLDKLAARIREIATHVLRALRLPLTSDAVDSLGTPTVRKGGFPHFNDTTGDLEVVNVIGEGEIISTAMRPVVEAATLGAARTAMDVAEADAGVPTGGTDEQSLVKDGATALATKWKSLKTTETVSTATATIAAPNRDHTVFSDTATLIGAIALTITDATNENARLTIVNLGAFDTTLTMTGLTGETVPGGEARAYVWNGTGYTLASGGGGGGGGGDLAEIQVPQPKTWVDKGITPGVSITNQWGLGSFVLECEISGIGAGIYTSRIEVEDLAVSAFSNFFTSNGTNNADAKVIYNGSSGAFELTATVSSVAVAINRIQFYEDDPDNLPLQTIPSDPSLIKDWVKKFEDYSNTANITNVWGDGKYKVLVGRASNDFVITCDVVVDRSANTPTGSFRSPEALSSSYWHAQYSPSLNQFVPSGTGVEIYAIYRWEDVAGADAQMSVPVDGWERVYEDDANTSPVVNTWGTGYFRFEFKHSGGDRFSTIMNVTDVSAYVRGPTITGSITPRLQSGSFSTIDSNYPIVKIDKFNSLVNVLHSYVPDPRSVAQKDWVEIWNDSGAGTIQTFTLKVPNGFYKVTGVTSTGSSATTMLEIGTDGVTTEARGQQWAGSGGDFRVDYTESTGVWASCAGVTFYYVKIERWQDSQASDAPRTVLDDGWELIFDNVNNTGAVPQTEGLGWYKCVLSVSATALTEVHTSAIELVNLGSNNYGMVASDGSAVRINYRTATDDFICGNGSYFIKKLWKFTGLLRIDSQVVTNTSEGSNITNAVIDTDAGDVDCASYFTDTTQDRVVKLTNDGTNGNHLTNCPNSIEIGDGKTVQFYYNLGWRYEDVPIDSFSPVSGMLVHYWAGGRALVLDEWTNDANPRDISGAGLVSHKLPSISADNTGSIVAVGNISAHSNTSYTALTWASTSGAGAASVVLVTIEGRWKTGV